MPGPPVEDAPSRAERPDPVPAAERGSTVVADLVVAKIAARAAHEALAPLPPGVLPPEATAVVLLPPAREVRAGENPAGTARIQVGVELGYPTDIGGRCAAVRRRVAERVGALTGMAVHRRPGGTAASVPGTREDAMSEPQDHDSTRKLPVVEKTGDAELGQSSSASAYEPVAGTAGGGHRFWSVRQVPAGVVALLLLVAAGLLLYDLVAVRAGRPAMHWRRALAHRLAQQPLDSPWVLAGASVIVLLGVWLLVLAVTPGLRQVLPMRPTHDDLRAGLHRDAAATVLRDRALEVSGVRSVRVRMGRRRAEVRAVSHFRDLDEVRADLDTALADAVRDLGLHRHPALSVHVRRADRKR